VPGSLVGTGVGLADVCCRRLLRMQQCRSCSRVSGSFELLQDWALPSGAVLSVPLRDLVACHSFSDLSYTLFTLDREIFDVYVHVCMVSLWPHSLSWSP